MRFNVVKPPTNKLFPVTVYVKAVKTASPTKRTACQFTEKPESVKNCHENFPVLRNFANHKALTANTLSINVSLERKKEKKKKGYHVNNYRFYVVKHV